MDRTITRLLLFSVQLIALTMLLSGSLRALQSSFAEARELNLENRITRLETLAESNQWYLRALVGGMLGVVGERCGQYLKQARQRRGDAEEI